jgi:hypothetical protein
VAAEVGLPLFGGRRIWGVVRDVTLGYVTSPFQISDAASNTDKTNVDVGGDPYPFAPSYFCVVYESAWSGSDHDMLACMVDHNGVRYGGTVVVDNTSGTFDSEPAISKTNDASTWNMVWQRQVSAGDRDVYGARIAWNGVVTSHTFPIRTTWGFDESHPAVSGSLQGTQRYLVAYEGNYGDHDILLCMLDGTTPVVSDFDLSLAEGSHFLRNQIEPCVESNGRHFACSYAEQFSTSATDYDVYTVELLPVGASLLLNEPHTPLGVSTAPDRSPQIVCHESGDNNTATTVWWTIWNIQASVWGSGNSDEEAVAGFAGTNGGPITSFCGAGSSAQCPCGNTGSSGKGCGNSYDAAGGTLTASGSASTAADTLSMTFGGLPPFKSALLFQSPNVILSGFGSVFGDGVRCVSSPAFRFPIRNTNASGSAGFGPAYGDAAFSVVGGIPSFGGTYHYQVWYRDTADFCTGDFTNFTNALRVTWTP